MRYCSQFSETAGVLSETLQKELNWKTLISQSVTWITGVLNNFHNQIPKMFLNCLFGTYQKWKIFTNLTFSSLSISQSCIKIKIDLNFFCISLRCLKRFYEGHKGLPFDAPQ